MLLCLEPFPVMGEVTDKNSYIVGDGWYTVEIYRGILCCGLFNPYLLGVSLYSCDLGATGILLDRLPAPV